MIDRRNKHNRRQGLILLVVLGMLTLFTLLGVSYLLLSGNSVKSSIISERKEQRPTPPDILIDDVMKQVIRGTKDENSPFAGQSLLEDLYNSTPITVSSRLRSTFGTANDPEEDVVIFGSGFVKIPLDIPPRSNLSHFDHAYNGRILTFLQGPLAGRSFRILNYIGERFVPSGSPVADVDADASTIEYKTRFSVFINLSDDAIEAKTFGDRDLYDYLKNNVFSQPRRLAYDDLDNSYRFVINGAAFDGIGYGALGSSVFAGTPDYLNLGSGVWLDPDPSNPAQASASSRRLPVALFHNYYADTDLRPGEKLNETLRRVGGTNEGIETADYRDLFLAYQKPGTIKSNEIIPSFHRPEVVHYIARQYFDISAGKFALKPAELFRFLNVLDYACARPLSIRIYNNSNVTLFTQDAPLQGIPKSRNVGFSGSNATNTLTATPQLEINIDQWNNGDSPDQLNLQKYISWLVNGPWDVDVDNNLVTDSMWLDPNLPLMTAANGKKLKVLVGLMIEDLGGRIDVNRVGDLAMTEGSYSPQAVNFEKFTNDKQWPATPVANLNLGRGFGHGPGEISVNLLFGSPGQAANLLKGRYGVDAVPGLIGNDFVSRFRERETQAAHLHGLTSGLPGTQRSGRALGFDLTGTPRLSNNQDAGGNIPSDIVDDPYETRPRYSPRGDTPYSLEDLERVLRRYDKDRSMLPENLQSRLAFSSMTTINELITTRSAEIRNAPIGLAAAPIQFRNPSSNTPQPVLSAGNLLGWIRMVHEQRYRLKKPSASGVAPANPGGFDIKIHDPSLISEWDGGNHRQQLVEFQVLRELFPLEFRYGLRMNVNRAFGNGVNDDPAPNGAPLDNQVDEPEELENYPQNESYATESYTTGALGSYGSSKFGASLFPGRLASRQLYARHLYCLAQVIIPRNVLLPGMPAGSNGDEHLRARILAQWAVNVVDFRDNDASMTRFEYDDFPFGHPDPDPTKAKLPGWTPQAGNVVWGMEIPQLLLTESLCFHNKNVKDTDVDSTHKRYGTNAGDDSNSDQYRLPQGSLFFEVYHPRSTAAPDNTDHMGVPTAGAGGDDKLYNQIPSGNVALNVSALAPDAGNEYKAQPVWRIGISSHLPNVAARSTSHPNAYLQDPTKRGNFSNQVSQKPVGAQPLEQNDRGTGLFYDLSNPSTVAPLFDRIIWFANQNPRLGPGVNIRVPDMLGAATPDAHHRVFYNRSPGTLLMDGNSYMIVGPRPVTYIGSQTILGAPTTFAPSPQRIDLTKANSVVYRLDDTVQPMPAGSAFKSPIKAIVAANEPTGWNTLFPAGVGLNASEPIPTDTGYYSPMPTRSLAAGFPADSWYDYTSATGQLPTDPFDLTNPELNDPANPAAHEYYSTGTYPNYRYAYLQRLADPEIAYDPITNPYITVDWIGIDLTVFNGEDTISNDVDDSPKSIAFQSRYKNGALVSDGPATSRINFVAPRPSSDLAAPTAAVRPASKGTSFYSPLTAAPYETVPLTTIAPPAGQTAPYFRHQLGYVDANRLHSSTSLGFLNMGQCFLTSGSVSTTDDFDAFGPPVNNTVDANYTGLPAGPTIAPVAFNRPFASPFEVMMVPTTSISEIGYTLDKLGAGKNYPFLFDPYKVNTLKVSTDSEVVTKGYWLQAPAPPVDPAGPKLENPDMVMLLEMLETPPPFADGGKWIPPATGAASSFAKYVQDYNAPNNFLSNYTNAGKVNLNTAPAQDVLDAVEWNYTQPNSIASSWTPFELSRRGYSTAQALPFLVNPNPVLNYDVPSYFAGSLRPASTANLAPQPMRLANMSLPSVLQFLKFQTTGYGDGREASHPFFNYQRVMRLPNLVTNQSNVFSVRMTLGYFEYDPNSGLGAEHIGASGEAERHRAFFIIDRSVPVGFTPGEDLNSNDTILLRRVLQ